MSEILAINRDNPDESTLVRAADVVRSGGLIVYPTETLYGIGADVTNASAVGRINGVKQRPDNKPILMIVNAVEMMLPYVRDISPAARALMETFWPGPLTLVFKASDLVPQGLTQGSGTVGIRIPSIGICLKLLGLLGVPLTSTSANLAGVTPARTVREMQQQLKGIALFLDAGELPGRQPSTVVDVSAGIPRVLRSGAVGSDRIKQLLPDILT